VVLARAQPLAHRPFGVPRRSSRLVAPALLASEAGLLLVAARDGWLGPKLRAQLAVLAGLPRTLARRRSVQATRRVGSREFAAHLTSSLESPYLAVQPPGR